MLLAYLPITSGLVPRLHQHKIHFQNFDYTAQYNRIRERGIMHMGEEAAGSQGRLAYPASWQVGYKKWAAQQGEIDLL